MPSCPGPKAHLAGSFHLAHLNGGSKTMKRSNVQSIVDSAMKKMTISAMNGRSGSHTVRLSMRVFANGSHRSRGISHFLTMNAPTQPTGLLLARCVKCSGTPQRGQRGGYCGLQQPSLPSSTTSTVGPTLQQARGGSATHVNCCSTNVLAQHGRPLDARDAGAR